MFQERALLPQGALSFIREDCRYKSHLITWRSSLCQVHFVFQERALLPQELLDHTKKHKRRKAVDNDLCKQAAQDEAEGVESQRLQNLAITLDKVSRLRPFDLLLAASSRADSLRRSRWFG